MYRTSWQSAFPSWQCNTSSVWGITWLSAAMCHLAKCRPEEIEIWALAQVTEGHLFKCHPPLGWVQGLALIQVTSRTDHGISISQPCYRDKCMEWSWIWLPSENVSLAINITESHTYFCSTTIVAMYAGASTAPDMKKLTYLSPARMEVLSDRP